MTYYTVVYNHCNGAEYREDKYEFKCTEVVCPTIELAREYIAKYCVPEYEDEEDAQIKWVEVDTKGRFDEIRRFERENPICSSWIETEWYTIETTKAYEGE